MRILRSSVVLAGLASVLAIVVSAQQAPKPGSPVDALPSSIKHWTAFGERPSWSPDGTRLAFISKSFGDPLELDLKTGLIKLLTPYPHAGFLRVQYLPNGDYLLIGVRKFENATISRSRDWESFVLKRGAGPADRPIALDQTLFEGVAISTRTPLIAWANTYDQHPELVKPGESVIYTAEIADSGGPKLVNKREIVRGTVEQGELEPQDFRNNDTELIFSAYRKKLTFSDVMGVNLTTKAVVIYRQVAEEYNEAEGIFVDGQHLILESSKDLRGHNTNFIDLWKFKLEPNGRDLVRLTRFGDYDGYKATNPVISRDGRSMAFQLGRSGEAAGVGHGIFTMDLNGPPMK